ncbi:hypothetical protein [Limnohabitans sp. DM1]|uniref:hypothetical protein n=1 Tax=Limnohabitans sp. DM1 TaxID=1597955 RepID=UPI000B1E01FF|nr:hypothetical protein [Limnohabitans sp. DM1]
MNTSTMTFGSGIATPKTSKLATILQLFLQGLSLNRFEAERHHDHCLHSTVSTLQNGHGILIAREHESVPCKQGAEMTRVCRYRIDPHPDNIKRARDLLVKLERTT